MSQSNNFDLFFFWSNIPGIKYCSRLFSGVYYHNYGLNYGFLNCGVDLGGLSSTLRAQKERGCTYYLLVQKICIRSNSGDLKLLSCQPAMLVFVKYILSSNH